MVAFSAETGGRWDEATLRFLKRAAGRAAVRHPGLAALGGRGEAVAFSPPLLLYHLPGRSSRHLIIIIIIIIIISWVSRGMYAIWLWRGPTGPGTWDFELSGDFRSQLICPAPQVTVRPHGFAQRVLTTEFYGVGHGTTRTSPTTVGVPHTVLKRLPSRRASCDPSR